MKILLTFDSGYAPHAATVMESIIQNCPEKLDFAVIYYNLDAEIQDAFHRHFINRVNSINFYEADVTRFKNVKSFPHITNPINVILRLLAPFLLPESDEYVLYLDCDTIVEDNILKLLDGADLSKPVCAATEYNPNYKLRKLLNLKPIEISAMNTMIYDAYWYRTYLDLEIPLQNKYFCAAVLLINLQYWRFYKISEQAIEFILKYPERAFAADQDALNSVIKGDFYELHPRWNFMYQRIYSGYSVEALREASTNPSVTHFKGWNYMSPEAIKKKYVKYRQCTMYPTITYKDKTLKNIIKKTLNILFGKIANFLSQRNIIKSPSLVGQESFFATARLREKV